MDINDDDAGLFGPDSVTWRVHADPVFAVAGFRALLLQALHPRAMAAVVQAGGFADDPWGRLTRTSQYVATTTYGSTRDALRAAARVRGIHPKLHAHDPFTGEVFRIDDPDLLLWVHCCEVESLLDTTRRAGLDLSAVDSERYVAEQVRSAELVGLPASMVPATEAELATYFRDVQPALALTAEAWEASRQLAAPPMPAWVKLLTPARPAWHGLTALSMSTLPAWARRMYKLPGLTVTDKAATKALRGLRRTALAVPERWRDGPTLRAAKARVAA